MEIPTFTEVLSGSSITGLLLLAVIIGGSRIGKPRRAHLPPGPLSLPLVGSLPFLGSLDIRKASKNLRRKYGDVFRVSFAGQEAVVVCGYQMVREALLTNGDSLAGRPDAYFFQVVGNGKGIMWSQGDLWKANRQLFHQYTRSHAYTKLALEDVVRAETSHLLSSLQRASSDNKPINVQPIIARVTFGILNRVFFDERLNYDDDEEFKTLDMLMEMLTCLQNIPMFSPVMKHCPGDVFGVRKVEKIRNEILEHTKRLIHGKGQLLRDREDATDLISTYLKRCWSSKGNTLCSELEFQYIVYTLYILGVQTTAATITWAVLYMVKYQLIQTQVYNEINDVIGFREPAAGDEVNMPLTRAVLSELQRVIDLMPISMPHSTLKPVHLGGYTIPRDTMVIINMHSVLHDADTWLDPEVFNPGRFLDDDNQYVKRRELIPHSIGPRSCPGESLSHMELFLQFTSMLQRFKFQLPPGTSELSLHTFRPFKLLNMPPTRQLIVVTER